MKWAASVPKDQLPAILRQAHTDWPRLFQWVPRAWTSWLGDPPVQIEGNAPNTQPIPQRGTWLVTSPFYIAFQTSSGWYARLGFRWDDVDRYYAVSFTIKHFT